jgi:hypothetical protein
MCTSGWRNGYQGKYQLVVQWLRREVAGFPTQRSGFEPGSGHVGFMVDKAAMGQVLLRVLRFPCQSSHRLLHTHHHTGLVQEASIGLSNSRLGSTPPKKGNKSRLLNNDKWQLSVRYRMIVQSLAGVLPWCYLNSQQVTHIFCAVREISNQSKQLVLPRTSNFKIRNIW